MCKVNAIIGTYFISLTIFGSIADKMAKSKYWFLSEFTRKQKTGTKSGFH